MLEENKDILNSVENIDDFEMKQTAGKVSFNTASAKDYFSNEAYKTLRTNLLFCGSDIKAVVITSCHENEGKSTVSTELSKSLAEIGKKTLLIDADLRKSMMLRKSIKAQAIMGLSELLSDQCSLNQAIYSTQHSDFDVIFCGHFPPNPVELLGSESFGKLMDELRKKYDYIIIDTPPLGPVIDAAVIAASCDGAIFVISQGTVSINEAKDSIAQLEKSGCKILGAVMNDVEMRKKRYYKQYAHKYQKPSIQ